MRMPSWRVLALISCAFLWTPFGESVVVLEVTKLNSQSLVDANYVSNSKNKIRFVLLAPANDSVPYSLNKTLPAVIYAVRSLEEDAHLKKLIGENSVFEVLYQDTQCSSTYGPLAAFDFYIKKEVDVFLGRIFKVKNLETKSCFS